MVSASRGLYRDAIPVNQIWTVNSSEYTRESIPITADGSNLTLAGHQKHFFETRRFRSSVSSCYTCTIQTSCLVGSIMTLIDPLQNALRADLLAGKPDGLFSCWDKLKPQISRKRHGPMSCCDGSDFLKQTSTSSDDDSVFRPVASVSETRFHRGFYRRMRPDKDNARNAINETMFQRFHQGSEARTAAYLRDRHNTVTGVGCLSDRPSGIRRGPQMVSVFDESRRQENYRRVRTSEGRFHESGYPLVKANVDCESVLLGFPGGRKRQRAQSVGIFDNFAHTQQALPRPFVLPERRNKSQIVFG